MSEVRSKDGTAIAYERSGNGPALILVDGALCSRSLWPLAQARAAARPAFHRLRVRPPRPRTERRHAAVCAGARDGGHRGDDRGGRRIGVSARPLVRRRAGARSRGQRTAVKKVVAYEPPYVDDSGQRGGAAYEGHLQRLIAAGRARRRGEILHEGHGRRAGIVRRDDAADAVDLAQARSGGPHASRTTPP